MVALLIAAAIAVATSYLVKSSRELALIEENRELQAQLVTAENRITGLSGRLNELEERDQELYRVLLQTDRIPSAVREVGVGGSEPYGEFNRFSTSTAKILTNLISKLDQLERRIQLQSSSTHELLELADMFEKRVEELPSIMPSTGKLGPMFFRMRMHPIYKTYRFHQGADIITPVGTPVYATAAGIVEEVEQRRSGYGIHILLRHPASGYMTLYAHLSEAMPNIQPGQRVIRGQRIALSGNTGLSVAPHVHYEVRDSQGRAINPFPFLAHDMSTSEYQAIVDAALQK